MQRIARVPTMLAAALALSACGEGITSSAETLSAADAQLLAAGFGAQDAAVLGGFGTPSFNVSAAEGGAVLAATTVTTGFTRTRTCPAGGSVTVQGTQVTTFDRETRTGSHQFSAVRTENACAWTGRGGAVITVNGNPNTQLTATHSVTGGVPGVGTATKKGSFTWSHSGGRSGTCTVDLTQTWDPATRTFTLKGTFCNQTIDLTRTWTES